jgi:hypothetical protein
MDEGYKNLISMMAQIWGQAPQFFLP